MKKITATIFLLVYFIISSGATIQLHYCMDKIVSWSLTSKGKFNCDKCGMAKKAHKGCCHDERKFIKLDKAHKASFNYFNLLKLQYPTQKFTWQDVEDSYVINPMTSYPVTYAPPSRWQVPVYLFNSVFRI